MVWRMAEIFSFDDWEDFSYRDGVRKGGVKIKKLRYELSDSYLILFI